MVLWLVSVQALASCGNGAFADNLTDVSAVPADVQFFLQLTGRDNHHDYRLLDAERNELDIAIDPRRSYALVTPTEPLTAGTHVLEGAFSDAFLVDPTLALPAPGPRSVIDVTRNRARGNASMSVVLGRPGIGEWIEVEVAEEDDFVDAQVLATASNEAYAADNECDFTMAGYEHGRRYYVRARAVGLDGQTSPWSDTFVAKGGSPLACSTTSQTLGGLTWLLLAGLLRRRRYQSMG